MKILFQGDSITDSGRDKELDVDLGKGYARFVEAALGFEEPNEHTFINKGIRGNRVVDVYARIKRDIINLKPDLMSILVGVNDVWHDIKVDDPNGVDAEKYFKIYCMLIEEIKEALPDIKIIILEPFVLEGPSTELKFDIFKLEVSKRAEKAKMVAQKYNLPFVPLQKGFDQLCEKAPSTYWLKDGVHPTAKGHEFLKQEWIKAYKAL